MLKRLFLTIRLNTIISARKRAEWLRKKNIFRKMGENVSIQLHTVPLYPQCIAFHNNIVIASDVGFATHDAIHEVLNRMSTENKYIENVGCIEIMDNCFIGAHSSIMPNVRIGPNAIVAAGSVVTKDVPPNTIVAGVPAKVVGQFNVLMEKREAMRLADGVVPPHAQQMSQETADYYWKMFHEAREQSRGEHNES